MPSSRRNRTFPTPNTYPIWLCDRICIPTNYSKKKRLMLILTRREGVTIKIGDDIGVKILSVKGDQVRIGITAPKEVALHREEIYERTRETDTH